MSLCVNGRLTIKESMVIALISSELLLHVYASVSPQSVMKYSEHVNDDDGSPSKMELRSMGQPKASYALNGMTISFKK